MKEEWQKIDGECVKDLKKGVFVCYSDNGEKLFETEEDVPFDRPSIHGDYKLEPIETMETSGWGVDLKIIKRGKKKEVKRNAFELYQRVR